MNNQKFKRYFSNEFSMEERNRFEREMEDDDNLNESIEGMENWIQTNEHKMITTLEKELFERTDLITCQAKRGNILINLAKYATAACIIGILSIPSWRLIKAKKSVDEEALFVSFFKPLSHPDWAVRGGNSNSVDTQAIQAYEKEDYFASVHYYENLVSDDPKNVRNNLFLGISLLATNQSQKSINILRKIIQSEDFYFDIHWYLALAYIKNKEIQNARAILQILTKDKNYYQAEAGEILEKLSGKIVSNK